MGFNVPSGGSSILGGQISSAWGSLAQTYMSFSAYNNGAFNEIFRMDGRGLFGIGTANPTSKLHVVSGTDVATSMLNLDTGVHGGTSMAVAGTVNNESTFDLSVYRGGVYASRFGVNSAGNVYLQPGAGNVAIGASNTTFKLDVQGGQLNASGGLCINGDCKTSWSQVGGGGSSQWTTSGSNIYFNTGNVGIGTATPDSLAKLHLYASGGFGQEIQTTTNDWTRLRFITPSRTWGFFLDGGSAGLGTGKFGLYDYTASAWRIVADTGGKVGIGTTSPLYSLDVNGGVNGFRAKASTSSGSDAIATFENSNGISAIIRGNGNVGIGTSTPANRLEVMEANPASASSIRVLSGSASAFTGYAIGRTATDGYWGVAGGATHYANTAVAGDVVLRAESNLILANGANPALYLKSNGNVGIGNSSPSEKLHVTGNGKITGNLTVDGNLAAKYQDLAEWVPSAEQLSPGTVVVLDSTKSNQVISSSQSYDTRVAGVISAQPGITLGESGQGKVLVATTGRVRVKVDATRAPIHIGDLLVTSDVTGVAMKSEALNLGGVQIHRPGTLIGKALEPLEKGKGEILVLLSLQ